MVFGEPLGVSGDTDDNVGTASVREQRGQPRDVAVSIAHRLRHLTEGFYVTAVNEASNSCGSEIVPTRTSVAKERR